MKDMLNQEAIEKRLQELEKLSPKEKLHWEQEMKKCIDSPYYFATTYLTVNGMPFTTLYTEEEFNEKARNYDR